MIVHYDCSMFFGNRFFNTFGYGIIFNPNTNHSEISKFNKALLYWQQEKNYYEEVGESINEMYKECSVNEKEKDGRYVEENVTFLRVQGLWIILGVAVLIAAILHIALLIYKRLFHNKDAFMFKGPTSARDKNISKKINDVLKEEIEGTMGEIKVWVEELEEYLGNVEKKYNLDFKKEKLNLPVGLEGILDNMPNCLEELLGPQRILGMTDRSEDNYLNHQLFVKQFHGEESYEHDHENRDVISYYYPIGCLCSRQI